MLSLPETVSLVRKNALIETLVVDNQYARATIALWGGHILSFIPKHDERERLFTSESARFDGSKSIRAGVPVCWPWFGAHPDDEMPMHGYVRTRPWHLLKVTDEATFTEMVLVPESTSGEGFEGEADLQLTIQVGKQLCISLSTTNTGVTDFTYNAALHTYFAVRDIAQTELEGLSGVYTDKVRDWARFETPSPYRFTEQTDRIHLNPVKQMSIKQEGIMTGIESGGHDSVVVWNPWAEVSESMIDMTDTGYQKMLCVETAVTQGVRLEPGQTHCLKQLIS